MFDSKNVSERAKGPGWKRAYDSVQLAAIPHMLYKDQWEQRRLLEEKRGPGVYDTKDLVDVLSARPSSKLGVCSTRVPRFRVESQVCVCVCVCSKCILTYMCVSASFSSCYPFLCNDMTVCWHCSFETPSQVPGRTAREVTRGASWRRGTRGLLAPRGCWTMEGQSSGNCPPL